MNREGDMTLAFELDALSRLAEPGVAVSETETWTTYVGIVSDEAPDRITAVADRFGVSPDFTGSVTGESDGLPVVGQHYLADRHVFVGTADDDREAARSLDWEYLDVAVAAEKAGWSLASADGRWRSGTGDSESNGKR